MPEFTPKHDILIKSLKQRFGRLSIAEFAPHTQRAIDIVNCIPIDYLVPMMDANIPHISNLVKTRYDFIRMDPDVQATA